MLYRRKNKKRTSYDVDEFLKCVFIVNFILFVFTLISNCYNRFRAAHYMAFEYAIVFRPPPPPPHPPPLLPSTNSDHIHTVNYNVRGGGPLNCTR